MRTWCGCGESSSSTVLKESQSVAATASATLAWIGNTLVRPVIRKILRMRSCVHTRRRLPSWARTRLSPPTRTPRPGVEELDGLHVDDQVVVAGTDQVDELLAQLRGRVDVDLATDHDDRAVALGAVFQRQVHGVLLQGRARTGGFCGERPVPAAMTI